MEVASYLQPKACTNRARTTCVSEQRHYQQLERLNIKQRLSFTFLSRLTHTDHTKFNQILFVYNGQNAHLLLSPEHITDLEINFELPVYKNKFNI